MKNKIDEERLIEELKQGQEKLAAVWHHVRRRRRIATIIMLVAYMLILGIAFYY